MLQGERVGIGELGDNKQEKFWREGQEWTGRGHRGGAGGAGGGGGARGGRTFGADWHGAM
jgi:hypothetical protein